MEVRRKRTSWSYEGSRKEVVVWYYREMEVMLV